MAVVYSHLGGWRRAVWVSVALISAAMLGAAAQAEPSEAGPSEIIKDCPYCPALRVIPPGRFVMGSDDGEPGRPEGPVREVNIAHSFALGLTEVTVGEFRAFVEATGHQVSPGCRAHVPVSAPGERVVWRDQADRNWQNPGFSTPQLDEHPVVCIGHGDASAYVQWLRRETGHAYRLPTEAEWEYAARAGGTGIYFWGNNIDLACRHANVYDLSGRALHDLGWGYASCEDGFAQIAPVGQFEPNAFGLHDMLGNVWEWTADCYQLTYDDAPTDGSASLPDGECARWTVRGGGWMTRPTRQRISFRGRDPVDARYNYFGMRVARDWSASAPRP